MLIAAKMKDFKKHLLYHSFQDSSRLLNPGNAERQGKACPLQCFWAWISHTCLSNSGYCLDFVPPLLSPRLPPFQLLWKHKGAFRNQKRRLLLPPLFWCHPREQPSSLPRPFKTTEVFPGQPMHREAPAHPDQSLPPFLTASFFSWLLSPNTYKYIFIYSHLLSLPSL